MTGKNDREYYLMRAAAERELSQSATSDAGAAIHAQLAERYERLAARSPASRPVLRIVVPQSA